MSPAPSAAWSFLASPHDGSGGLHCAPERGKIPSMIPKRSSKQGPEDVNESAFRVFQAAVGNSGAPATEKNPHAVALGRSGGLKGGKARAASLTPEQRQEIARNAVNARWAKKRAEGEA